MNSQFSKSICGSIYFVNIEDKNDMSRWEANLNILKSCSNTFQHLICDSAEPINENE